MSNFLREQNGATKRSPFSFDCGGVRRSRAGWKPNALSTKSSENHGSRKKTLLSIPNRLYCALSAHPVTSDAARIHQFGGPLFSRFVLALRAGLTPALLCAALLVTACSPAAPIPTAAPAKTDSAATAKPAASPAT